MNERDSVAAKSEQLVQLITLGVAPYQAAAYLKEGGGGRRLKSFSYLNTYLLSACLERLVLSSPIQRSDGACYCIVVVFLGNSRRESRRRQDLGRDVRQHGGKYSPGVERALSLMLRRLDDLVPIASLLCFPPVGRAQEARGENRDAPSAAARHLDGRRLGAGQRCAYIQYTTPLRWHNAIAAASLV